MARHSPLTPPGSSSTSSRPGRSLRSNCRLRNRSPLRPSSLKQVQGLSLVELLIGVVISIVVLGGSVQLLVSLIRSDTATQVELNRKDGVSRVLGLLQDEIRNAQRVESGSGLSALTGCTTTPLLILRGRTAGEDISYGLLVEATSAAWRGPSRLVRCGLPYNTNGQLDTTATRSEQVLLDSLTATGFTATTLGGTGTISRNVALTLVSDASGTPLTSTVQVPINTNQIYGLASSGVTGTCPSGTGSVTTGCVDPSELSIHYRPTLVGSSITGSTSQENIFYFDGLFSDYQLRRTSVVGSGPCTREQCTVVLGSPGNSVTFTNGNVLVFRDRQIRL